MKATILAIALTLAFAASHAGGKKPVTPNAGRLIDKVEPKLEFFVTKDRRVEITPLDASNKPIATGAQVVTVIAGERSNPTKLALAAKDGKFTSEGKLPAGNDFPVVVQIKANPDAKTVNEKFNLNLEPCPDCKVPEYACVCHGDEKK